MSEQPYAGRAAEAAARAKANRAKKGPTAKQRIATALYWLKSDHVQKSKFRLGAIGSQDIDNAIAALEK